MTPVSMLLLLSRFFCWLPLSWALAIGRAFGYFWYYVLPIRRKVALQNVRRALGQELSPAEQRRVVRRCFVHLGMYGVESLRLPMLTPELSARLVDRGDYHILEALLARGQGLILVTAHIGQFDLSVCSQAIRGLPVHVIFKDIKWQAAHRLWFKIRTRTGIKPIAPRRSKEEIKAALRQGDAVGFVIDQHMAPHRAIVCELFGQLAATSPAPVRFGFETGAPILPAVMFRSGPHGHHRIHFEPEFVLETPYETLEANIYHNTERLNRILESWIRKAPEQWLWLHKRWKVHDNPEGWPIPAHLEHLVGAPR